MRNFHSFRRMTRRSSTCRSALLMVLPKRRNNLHISTWPGVLSVISVHQRLSMARMLMAGAGAGASAAGLGAAGSGFMGASGAGSGAAGSGASMPSFLIRLRRWLSRCDQAFAHFTSSSPFVRCAEESSPQSRSLAPFTFSKAVPLGSASAALTAASRRSCAGAASRSHSERVAIAELMLREQIVTC